MKAGFPGAGVFLPCPYLVGLPWLPPQETQCFHAKVAPLFHTVREEMLREELEPAKLGALKICTLMFPALDPSLSHLMVFGGEFLFILSTLLPVSALLRKAHRHQ